jgi:periplasmic protein TonB
MMVPNSFIPRDPLAGAGGRSAASLRTMSPVPPGQEPFKEALLEKSFEAHKRTPLDWVVSIAVHAALVVGIVIIPMMVTQQLDLTHFQATYLVNPAPPGAPPPPPPPGAAAARPQQAPHRPSALQAKLFAPIAIPKTVAHSSAADAASAEAPPIGVEGGVPGGVFGGQLGGVLGGVLGGGSTQPVVPPSPVAVAAPTGPLHVGGDVKPPRAISRPAPVYPLLAKNARIQGVVEIEAIIDEHGNVVQAHVMDGPALLFEAALKAVSLWKYEPTYLNGQPYPVDLMIQVTFNLG